MRPLLPTALLLLLAGPCLADDPHDRALAARRAGEIAPLQEILAVVAEKVPGTVIEVELKSRRSRYVYEIEVRTPDGLIVETFVDAKSKQLLDSHVEGEEPD